MVGRGEGDGQVVRLVHEDVPRVVDALGDAFREYPVMRFVIGECEDYADRLGTLVRFFVTARALRNEPLLGIVQKDIVVAAATVSFSVNAESPRALGSIRESTWRELGADARSRYEACGDVWHHIGVAEPNVHMNMIGVRESSRGNGYAGLLLDHVHEMSRVSPDSGGVSLTTEDSFNVPFYLRAGYEIVGQARIAPGLETWGFFRPDA